MPADKSGADAVCDNTLSFSQTVRARRSFRSFLKKPVPDEIIREVLEEAQLAPSQCNTQPWSVHIVSGAKLEELAKILSAKNATGELEMDFSFDMSEYAGKYKDRVHAFAKLVYASQGVEREDKEGRAEVAARNFTFFGAPHAAFLFMPVIGDNVRTAGDVGMYGQTFLLSLAARGLAGIPQTSLGFYADTVREVLGVPADMKLLFGISFGYGDEDAPANSFRVGRVPIKESVTFHQ